jgi:two-component system, OmpR family, alkaline phosphatase synthesis response regulator PhoP
VPAGGTILAMANASKRILICDDDPVILRLLQVNLELEGYEVLLAHHGEKAIEMAAVERPDLVILDIMMPRMDGYQTLQAIKERDETKDIPIVFLSAKAQHTDVEKGRSFGVEDYLTKPFDPSDLIEVVERLVG